MQDLSKSEANDSSRQRLCRQLTKGFTLIEVMVVLAIIGILVTIASPSYLAYVQKNRRSDAVLALQQIQLEQEKLRANCTSYAATLTGTRACGTLGYPSATTTDGFYSLSLSGVSATAFTVTATAVSTKAQFQDTDCRQIILAVNGLTLTKTSQNAAGTATTNCWSK